ncbi:MAG: hypothetical protein KDA96_18420, partial [Planctomycetaceae bacterium]|nr:hypothetical protein [Planctomycetaceae bacterium]
MRSSSDSRPPFFRLSLHLYLVTAALLWTSTTAIAADEPATAETYSCAAPVDAWFVSEVWEKVGATDCLRCHRKGGDAAESRFLLQDPGLLQGGVRDNALRQNQAAFRRMAEQRMDGGALLLRKATGELEHGGSVVLKPESTSLHVLREFVERLERKVVADDHLVEEASTPFFAGIVMLDDQRLLRRATLSLAGRLPTTAERNAIAEHGSEVLPDLLNALMREEAFYARLREGFNDIFLTQGIDGNPDSTVLSYEHFEKSRLWYQKHDLTHITDEKERRQAGYKLANEYRQALLEEPMRLIDHIVRNDRPFTEIVTA